MRRGSFTDVGGADCECTCGVKLILWGCIISLLLFFMGWLGHVGLGSLMFLSGYMPQFHTCGFWHWHSCGVVMAAAVVYILLRSQTRMDRLNAALAIWFSAIIMIYVFRGGLM